MEVDGIGLVLAKAGDLKSKITTCIQKSSESTIKEETCNGDEGFEEEAEAEAESLLNIRDALECLETQLASLQALQLQQRYEKQSALSDIDDSRKMLLKKLMEYKGEDLEVIREASAFASESVEHSNDLLLPPYPSHPPRSLPLDNGYLPHFSSIDKSVRNGFLSNLQNETSKVAENTQVRSSNPRKGLGFLISSATKMVITVVGVVSILSLAGFEPRFRRKDDRFKFLGFLQLSAKDENRAVVQCPPGKVMVVENGETRCLVKERVEIPFEPVVRTPDVNYGCG